MTESSTQGPEQQLADFFSQRALQVPKDLILDGKPQRFGEGEKGREAHWYVGSKTDDGGVSLTIGSHKDPTLKATFRSKGPNRAYWSSSNIAEKWASSKLLGQSPYLERKKINSLFGARINYFGDLVIPMFKNETLVGLQTIKPNHKAHDSRREKSYVTGSKKKEAYYILEVPNLDISKIYVTEGFATAASVCMASNAMTVCAFDCANVPLVVKVLKEKYPTVPIIIAGDDDRFSTVNSGRKTAEKIAAIANAVFPIFSSDEGKPKDWNDLHAREGIEVVKKQLEDAIHNKQAPLVTSSNPISKEEGIKVISGWEIETAEPPTEENYVLPGLLSGDVGILCSPGGFGKSGVALLIAYQIACGGKNDFLGFGPLVGGACCYLTLEDPPAVFSKKQRTIKADFSTEEYQSIDMNLHLLDGREFQNSVNAISLVETIKRGLKKKGTLEPLRLLIVDHLSYWSAKDLNDGRICGEILKEFKSIATTLGCAVLFLHHGNRSAMTKGKDKPSPSSTIGGSYKLHSLARWVAFLDEISARDLKKEFKVTEEGVYKTLVLDKVNHGKKLKLLLKHCENRDGLLYKDTFAITNPLTISRTEAVEVEVVPKEVAENFNMGDASPKLMTIDDNTHHIMNWLTRNPAFETVSPKRRNELTGVVNGEDHDKDRPVASMHKDVWVAGDILIVAGPVCDQEDMKLYAVLVRELTQNHKDGNNGLILKISIKAILRLLRLYESGENVNRIKRQLNRLVRMSLTFKNAKGRAWMGPLLTEVLIEDDGRSCHLKITFSQFMIAYYRAHEYTTLNKDIFWTLSGDSATLFAFYTSQSYQEQKISIEQLKKLLAIPEAMTQKAVVRRITTAYKKLLATGIFDPQKTKFEKNILHTFRA